MAELAVAGSAVGIISLGIQVSQGLFNYYSTFKSQNADADHVARQLSELLSLLSTVDDQLANRKFRPDEQKLLDDVQGIVRKCDECIDDMNQEAEKIRRVKTDDLRSAAKAAGRRLAYPLRKSTMEKMNENVEEMVSHLLLALQILQQRVVDRISEGVDETKAVLDLVRVSQVNSEIITWLKAPEPSTDFNVACKKKHLGTGLWYIKGPSFNNWLEQPKSFQWLNGFAGCGKSVLCSTAIQHTLRHRRSNPRIGLAFFFFTFRDEGKQHASGMLKSVVLQLSAQLGDSCNALEQMHRAHTNASPTNEALMMCLDQLVRAFGDVYILLDALDESPSGTQRDEVLDIIEEIRSSSSSSLHILVTSRDEVDIRQSLRPAAGEDISLKNTGVQQDIKMFVSQHLRTNRRFRKWEDHYDQIELTLSSKAKGVFRWVECQFIALAACPASQHLLEDLLESLPPDLDGTYKRMLQKIPPSSRSYARQMLTILCYAGSPPSPETLIDAIAIEVESDTSPRWNPKRKLKNWTALQEVCPGFVEIAKAENADRHVVRIAHFSVQEYLESDRLAQHDEISWFKVNEQQGNALMSQLCFTMLADSSLEAWVEDFAQRCSEGTISGKDFKRRLQGHWPLARYATDFAIDHYRGSPRTGHSDAQIVRLLNGVPSALSSGTGAFANWVIMNDLDALQALRANPGEALRFFHLLGVLAELKFSEKVDLALRDALDTVSRLALSTRDGVSLVLPWIIRSRSERTLQAVLMRGADPNTEVRDREYIGDRPALHMASEANWLRGVQILLEHGANVNAQNRDGERALFLAAEDGHVDIARLLLDRGADPNAQNKRGMTALFSPPAYGGVDIVRLLLDRGADINAQDNEGETALFSAAKCQSRSSSRGVQLHLDRRIVEFVRFLLDRGADVNVQATTGATAFYYALLCGQESAAQYLFDIGVDTQYALHGAAGGGRVGFLQHFLGLGMDINAIFDGWTPLHCASFWRRARAVEFLVEHGADIHVFSIPNHDHRFGDMTALHLACRQGEVDTVRVLLSKGADTNAESETKGKPLQTAAHSKWSNTKVVQLLLDAGVDVNAQDKVHGTALQAASSRKLDPGDEPDELFLAREAERARDEMVQFLRDRGAV